jgi:hypothetical protein
LKEDHQRRLQLLPPAVAAAAASASPTGAEQSAFSLRWRLQIQPLLLHRDKRTPQAAPQAPPSGLAARSQLNSDTPLVLPPPEADEKKKLSQPPNPSSAEGK